MKLLLTFSVLLSLLSAASCKDGDDAKSFTLTVHNGTGSGTYREGQLVEIVAEEAEQGQQFDQWTGDVEFVNTAGAAEAKVTMPARNIAITATYKDLTPLVITIDPSVTHQTIDGFGFFGGRDVWWGSGDASHFYNEAWLEKVVADLGLTIWRNEAYPHIPPDANNTPNQDAHWEKQRPLIEALRDKAEQHEVNMKFIVTAWSPPAAYKWTVSSFSWAGDEDATRQPGAVTEKNGGTLSPEKYTEYGEWWSDLLALYEASGVTVYAISLQNEPMFSQSFNSAIYTTTWYNEMLANVVPVIRSSHPSIKVFGSENMLEMEGKTENYPYFYHNGIKSSATASAQLDILAVHGYQDGVAASSGSALAGIWKNHKDQFAIPMEKPTWMTETSGYIDAWEKTTDKPGAFSLAIDIQTALSFGDVSAWVHWQGSELAGIGEFNLMSDVTVGKKYYASKNFYRYIRPGAVRVEATSSDDAVAVSAFRHEGKGMHTIVLTNTSNTVQAIDIAFGGGPAEYEMFVTSATKNCQSEGMVSAANPIIIPARSVVTLQAGGTDL